MYNNDYYSRKRQRDQDELEYKTRMEADPQHQQFLDDHWNIIEKNVVAYVNRNRSYRGGNLKVGKVKKDRVFIVPKIKREHTRNQTTQLWETKCTMVGWEVIYYSKTDWDFCNCTIGFENENSYTNKLWKGTFVDQYAAIQRENKINDLLDELLKD